MLQKLNVQPPINLTVINGGDRFSQYAVNDNNVFNIIPPSNSEIKSSLCHTCTFFVKMGDCKRGELNEKAADVKLYTCKKYFAKQDIQHLERSAS